MQYILCSIFIFVDKFLTSLCGVIRKTKQKSRLLKKPRIEDEIENDYCFQHLVLPPLARTMDTVQIRRPTPRDTTACVSPRMMAPCVRPDRTPVCGPRSQVSVTTLWSDTTTIGSRKSACPLITQVLQVSSIQTSFGT